MLPRPWLPGDPPLRRVPRELRPGTPGGNAAWRLGQQVRAWREAHQMTQRELAKRLGWEQPAVARLESGAVAPTLTTLALLAERLVVRVAVAPGSDGPAVTLEAVPAAA
ncbi:MAG: helix-turn-helix domain-containing protein [Chloroflexota bacterium]